MDNLVSQLVKGNSAKLCEQFISAQPFRHIVIDDFLDETFARSLLDNFPVFNEKLAINENGEVGGKAVHEKISSLGPVWQKLDTLVAGEDFRTMISDITNVPELKFDPEYFGGGTHENQHGQGLNPHVDFNFHPVSRQHRRLNLILYLCPDWQKTWGGSIQLHRDPYKPPSVDEIVAVTPAFNRCVVFETNDHSWHGFERIDLPEDKRELSRKSFALYYYTDSRPNDELRAEHSTIYVERHLPESFRAGVELSAEQLQHVRDLLTSRDQHLNRLYADIQHLNTNLNYLRSQLTSDQSLEDIEINENDSEELKLVKNRVGVLNARIRKLQSSSSWRITRPLRALKRALTGKG